MEEGYLALVLHAHLPYVRHPEHDQFLEEQWFFEAMTETYIPLLRVFEGLIADRVPFRLTMSLTPPLLSMMTDPLLQERYLRYLDRLVELSEKEVERTRWMPDFHESAIMYRNDFAFARWFYAEKYGRNIVTAFRRLQDQGYLEIITCGATHGFMPLMLHRESVRAQIQVAVEQYTRFFGRIPRGIWMPECGFKPGDDELLREYGIRFFFTDAHGVFHASPRPKYGIYAPIFCPSGVAAFGRDLESSKQVWSAQEGYPGDPYYREFYRDIGYDLEYEYIRPYIHSSGLRIQTGIKYFRITGQTSEKQPYKPTMGTEQAAVHAGNFMFNREQQVKYLDSIMDRRPIIVSPYDAELFGHWWFEGPQWINFLFRKLAFDQNTIRPISPVDYLSIYPRNQVSTPSMSSWGYKGYNEVWLEGSNDWIYRHLHQASERMTEMANRYPEADGILRRALNQSARELLLAQSSDWAFIMKTGTMVEYAIKRTRDHITRFITLYEQINNNYIDEGFLSDLEYKDNIFPELDYRVYRTEIPDEVRVEHMAMA